MTGAAGLRRLLSRVLLPFLVLVLVLPGGCRRADRPDTPTVVLADGTAGDQLWRLEGRRLGGAPCVELVLPGVAEAPTGGCGTRRTTLRHLQPHRAIVGGRLLVFSPVAARARRVRLDSGAGSIPILPARVATGFPVRFFLADLDPGHDPLYVRVFADGGRAVPS